MDMRNTFRRWKNGWRGSKSGDIPCVAETRKASTYGSEASTYITWLRQCQIYLHGVDWIPFDKYCFAKGYRHTNEADLASLYRHLGRPKVGEPLPEPIVREMHAFDELFPARPPSQKEMSAAQTFYRVLTSTNSEPIWDNAYRVFNVSRYEINLIDHFVRSQYGLREPKNYDFPIEYIYWCIAGRPESWYNHTRNPLDSPGAMERNKRKHYHYAIRKVVFAVQGWVGCGTKCCDYPDELSPGVNALYTHHCRYKPFEVNKVFVDKPKTVTFIRKNETINNAVRHVWYAKTEKGEFPVTMGGEPENMDVLVQPFYRFEDGPEHGMSTCTIRVASGTPGDYCYIQVTKSMEIFAVRDDHNDHMECFTLPGDSPALAMFRIDCPLKSVL